MRTLFSIKSFNLFLLGDSLSGDTLLRNSLVKKTLLGSSLLISAALKRDDYKLRMIDVAHA